MSTQTPTAEAPRPQPPAEPPDPLERFIDQRLNQARRQVKGVDLAAALMRLAVGVLVYVLVVSVLDHWVFRGGLGFWGRLGAFSLLVGAVGWYAVREVVPPLVKRVNPIFAAYTIEQSRPSIKNSLINFLLLRGRRREMPRVIYRALEHRAVTDLKQVEIEAAIDRTHVLRLGYLLAATFALFCLYLILSPKSPMVSAARLLAPWADIPPPARVQIRNVAPGDAVVFQGDRVEVTAEVQGLRPGEEVVLQYSTADGQSTNQVVPLTKEEGDYRHHCTIPPDSRGFQQHWRYRLAAGDALTRWYDIRVEVPPVIEVESIRYDYPAYTGLAPRTVARQGDIRALEGTRVTIQGRANRPMRRAEIDLGCDGRGSVAMKVNERTAAGSFQLRFSPTDPGRPAHDCYQLRFVDQQGHWNPRPVRYQIDVIADLPPRVEILSPESDVIRLAPHDRLPVRVRAEDPDFALRRVLVRSSRAGQSLAALPLLVRRAPRKAWEGPVEGIVEFRPDQLGLVPGDVVMLWAEAEDNKEPTPNVGASSRRRIEIIGEPSAEAQPRGGAKQPGSPAAPAPKQPQTRPGESSSPQPSEAGQPPAQPGHQNAPQPRQPEEQQPSTQPPGQPSAEAEQPSGEESEKGGESGQGGAPSQPQGASATDSPSSESSRAQPSESPAPIDPVANPGDAFEEILRHRQEELAQNEQARPGGEQTTSGAQPNSGQPQQPQQPTGSPNQPSTSGQPHPDAAQQHGSPEAQQPSAQPPARQPAAGQQSSPEVPGQPQPGSEQPSTGQPPDARSGSQPDGQSSGAEQPTGSQRARPTESQGSTPGAQETPRQGSADQQSGQGSARQPSAQQNSGGSEQSGTQQFPGGQRGASQAGPDSESQAQGGPNQPARQPSGTQQGAAGQRSSQQPGGTPSPSTQPGPRNNPGQEQSGTPSAGQSGSRPAAGSQQPAQTGSRSQSSGEGSSAGDSPQQPGAGQPQRPRIGEPGAESGSAQQRPAGDEPGAGEQGGSRGSGGTQTQQPQGGGSQAEAQGGGQASPQQQTPGRGEPGQRPAGSTVPQETNLQRPKQPGQSGQSQQPSGSAQSPSTSQRQSDSSSETGGDRSGGGEQGGGQQAQQPGQGSPGSQTPAEQGGGVSSQPGRGPTGSRAGEQVPAGQPAGGQQTGPGHQGARRSTGQSGQGDLPGTSGRTSPQSAQPSRAGEQAGQGQQAGHQPGPQPGTHGYGNPTSGGSPGAQPPEGYSSPQTAEPGARLDPDLEFARRQTALALEHLKDELEKQDSDLLERLGWDRQQAQRFLERWQAMQRAAAQQSAQGEAARERLTEALKSLGLRPRGLELGGGQTEVQRVRQVQEGGRFEPPPEWSEQVREYLRGIAEGGR